MQERVYVQQSPLERPQSGPKANRRAVFRELCQNVRYHSPCIAQMQCFARRTARRRRGERVWSQFQKLTAIVERTLEWRLLCSSKRAILHFSTVRLVLTFPTRQFRGEKRKKKKKRREKRKGTLRTFDARKSKFACILCAWLSSNRQKLHIKKIVGNNGVCACYYKPNGTINTYEYYFIRVVRRRATLERSNYRSISANTHRNTLGYHVHTLPVGLYPRE